MQNHFQYLFAGAFLAAIATSHADPSAESPVTPTPEQTPSIVQVQTPSSTTPVKRFAPDGVFFVLERLSITTDSGITSVMPGTKVTRVRAGSPMRVTDGQHQYDAYAYQLTNDLDIGERLAHDEQAKQAKLKQEILQKIQEQKKLEQQASTTMCENANVVNERQQKIVSVQQRIKDVRQEIYENTPSSFSQPRLFPDAWRGGRSEKERRNFIEGKKKELRDLQDELQKLEAEKSVK